MKDQCHDIAEFGLLNKLAEGDPGLDHVNKCAVCRSHLAMYQRFLADCPEHADGDRESALGSFLEREIGAGGTLSTTPTTRSPWNRWLMSSLAAAAALVLFLALQQYQETSVQGPAGIVRADSSAYASPLLSLHTETAESGGLHLRWQRLSKQDPPEGETYRVVFFNGALEEVGRLEAGPNFSVMLSENQLRAYLGTDNTKILWRVEVLQWGDVLTRTPVAILPNLILVP